MIETERLRIYPATREQMETFIAAETDAELSDGTSVTLPSGNKRLEYDISVSECLKGSLTKEIKAVYPAYYDDDGALVLMEGDTMKDDGLPEKGRNYIFVGTALVVAFSVATLVCLIVAGCREKAVRGIGIRAAAALLMMLAGSVGTGTVPTDYFGVAERFSVFAAVGFNAMLGWHLFCGFGKGRRET